MPEEWLDHAQASNVDVLCFNHVTCGGGKVSTSLGSCCWALTVVFSWVGGLQLAWLHFPTPPDLRTNSDSFSPWFPLYCLSFICDAQLVRWLTWLSGFMGWNTGAQVIQKIRSDVLPFLSCLQFVHLWFWGWWRHYCPVLQRKLLGSTYTEHKWSWDNLSYLHHGKMMQCLVGLPGDGLTLPRSELKALGNLWLC